jgi:hypothetical protein
MREVGTADHAPLQILVEPEFRTDALPTCFVGLGDIAANHYFVAECFFTLVLPRSAFSALSIWSSMSISL